MLQLTAAENKRRGVTAFYFSWFRLFERTESSSSGFQHKPCGILAETHPSIIGCFSCVVDFLSSEEPHNDDNNNRKPRSPVEQLQNSLVGEALHGVPHREAVGVGERKARLGVGLEGRRIVHVRRGAHSRLRRPHRLNSRHRTRGGAQGRCGRVDHGRHRRDWGRKVLPHEALKTAGRCKNRALSNRPSPEFDVCIKNGGRRQTKEMLAQASSKSVVLLSLLLTRFSKETQSLPV